MKELTIEEAQQRLKTGKVSAKKLVKEFLRRIITIDKTGPGLNAVIELNPDALQIAEQLDRERKARNVRGPLHGIPIMIKDNINTADRMMTTAGSLALVGHYPEEDAFVVQQLRKAGAIIIGKTNLSEWANFRSTRSTSGWSSRGGLTKNPYILDRSACGSSSGSAVAAAANLCVAAVGTETDGSIICPAQTNGIVGIKPTLGLVSRTGIIPIAHSQDTAGPMARTVKDAAILLEVISGSDEEDAITTQQKKPAIIENEQLFEEGAIEGMRIGVARNFFGFNRRVDKLMEQAMKTLEQLGAEIIDEANIETTQDFREEEYLVLLYEMKNDMKAYLEKYGEKLLYKTLKDLIDFNEREKERVMPYFGQEHFLAAEEKGSLEEEEYLKALKKSKELAGKKGIDAALKKHRVEALIAPSGGPAWTIDLLNGDKFSGGSSSPAAVAGYPNITVPMGEIFDLPVGLSIISSAYKEETIIKIAYAFEQATKARKKPSYKKTLVLR